MSSKAQSWMIQGTASGVGKSVIVAGLCRLLKRRGFRVAPFKPQNMSNNAAVTRDGGEIGRAQALQAQACELDPIVDMNPVLIKPEADHTAQLIVRGKVAGRLQAARFREDRLALLETVLESFERLRQHHEIVIVEGAGSPAEPNLRRGDIANMGFAEAAGIPVWLLGDIHRGGVFAAMNGTLELLSASERARVQQLIINRFRGSRSLLDDAINWLQQRSGIPVAGVIPWLTLDLPEEDAPAAHTAGDDALFRIAVIAFPRMSNHDDVDPLAAEAGIALHFARTAAALRGVDLIILPGSKHVFSDLQWLRQQGMDVMLLRHLRFGGHVLGLCGGMQMLGQRLDDPGIEGASMNGLGLLPLRTRMQAKKVLRRISAPARYPPPGGFAVTGYEIHHGVSNTDDSLFPFACRDTSGQVWGSYVHGLFEQGAFRRAWLAGIGFAHSDGMDQQQRTLASLDRLADTLERELNPDVLPPSPR